MNMLVKPFKRNHLKILRYGDWELNTERIFSIFFKVPFFANFFGHLTQKKSLNTEKRGPTTKKSKSKEETQAPVEEIEPVQAST